jgi:hypothetical protein
MPGFVYVSYVNRVDTGHGIYYLLQSGAWIPGISVSLDASKRIWLAL